jgi:hypothetical protein
MGLKYYSNEFNHSKKISLLTSGIDMPIYSNDTKYQSRSSPSETYTSLQNYNGINYSFHKNIYANISKLPTDLSNDASYATLRNTTSNNSPILDENNNNNNRIYENVKLQTLNNINSSSSPSSSSSSPIYINVNDREDKPPIIPPSLRKTDQKEKILSFNEEIETHVLEKRSTSKTKQVS